MYTYMTYMYMCTWVIYYCSCTCNFNTLHVHPTLLIWTNFYMYIGLLFGFYRQGGVGESSSAGNQYSGAV